VELENSSKDIIGILQSAVTRAQQRRGLLKKTLFHRIDLSGTGNDPFSDGVIIFTCLELHR